jgi:acetyl esterase/lipase
MKNIISQLLFMTILNSGAAGMPLIGPAAETLTNVAYGKYAMQRMDVYLPDNRSADTTKSIILIHGGGWNSGSRHSFTSYIDSFKRRMPGYAIFNVDIKTAIDFITIHAGTYKINAGGLVLLGVSAGAHLPLLQAYKHNSPKIAAVIDFFGPTDLTEMYNKPWNAMIPHALETLIGGTPQTNGAAYRNSSSVSFISAATPPTLIFHGRQDYIVNISQSQLLHQKLQQAGIADKLVIYSNAGHGWSGATLSDSFDKIEAFLQKHVH